MTLSALIDEYYRVRGLTEPNEWEALGFVITEIGEAYEHLLERNKKFKRNNPQDKPQEWSAEAFGIELGDSIMMLYRAGKAVGVDPFELLREKLGRKMGNV